MTFFRTLPSPTRRSLVARRALLAAATCATLLTVFPLVTYFARATEPNASPISQEGNRTNLVPVHRGFNTDADTISPTTVPIRASATSSGDVLISQIYGGGGSPSTTEPATFKNDYVELYNRGSAPVSLSGWSLQHAGATTSFSLDKYDLQGTIQPAHYYLIEMPTVPGALGADLPVTPDELGNFQMNNTSAKIVLVGSTTLLGNGSTGNCPASDSYIDFVGYGSSATCFEGAGPAPTVSKTTAAFRVGNGATDSNNNNLDFIIGNPNPRSSGGTLTPCDPSLDTDSDGLLDCWETRGMDIDGDGIIDLQLNQAPFNADPRHKDIFVEIDYMEGDHTHKPRTDSLNAVSGAFARAPVANPDGTTGITLHLMLDEAVPHNDEMNFPDSRHMDQRCSTATSFDALKGSYFGTPSERADANATRILAAKLRVFRYAIFAHRQSDSFNTTTSACEDNGSSGVARDIPSSDFIVSLAPFTIPAKFKTGYCLPNETDAECGQRAIESGTFMHELGHTLGLYHGGFRANDYNCKPNYLSIMSYALQFPHLDPARPLDYSRQTLTTLNENGHLDESVGIQGPADRNAVFGSPLGSLDIFSLSRCKDGYCARTVPSNGPINWDNSLGLFYGNNVSADINRIPTVGCDGNGLGQILVGFNDWQAILESLHSSTANLNPSQWQTIASDEPLEPELTAEQAVEAAESADFDSDGRVNGDDNCPSVYNSDQADSDGNGIGNACQTNTPTDISVDQTTLQNPVVIGTNLTYVMTVTNNGPNEAGSVVVADSLPSETDFVSCSASGGGVCGGSGNNRTVTFASFSTGSSATITLVAHVNSSAVDGSIISNTASANSVVMDLNSVNNTATTSSIALSAPGNPLNAAQFFVRQHYYDFLSREPDAGGLSFWTNQITSCGSDSQCIEIKRINVSAAYFLSIEFQETGYLVYRMYKAAYGNLPAAPVPVKFSEFLPDTQQIGDGVQVGIGDWQTQLENNKVAFAQDFVSRSRFMAAFPTTMTPMQFVDALFTNAGVTPSAIDRNAAINEFGGAGNTSDPTARARALRRVAENSTLGQQELNKAFVLMQYFGYLRRNPNDPPEAGLDFAGYNFWLGKLNQFNGNFVNAEMVKAFIVSGEYQQRFGP